MSQANNIDLIKSAEERKYMKFEELALDALKDKLEQHPKVLAFKDSLKSIEGAMMEDKDKDPDEDGDDDTDPKKDDDKDEKDPEKDDEKEKKGEK